MAIGNRGLLHYFHADANAIGATIQKHEDKPFNEVFDPPPSVSLPPVGGRMEHVHRDFCFPKSKDYSSIIRASAANTTVTGDFAAGYPTTHSLAHVEQFDLLGRVKAEKVVSHIEVKHPPHGQGDVPRVTFPDTEIRKLVIDDKVHIEVILDLNLLALEDGDKCLRTPHLKDERLWNRVCRTYDSQAGYLICTLVKDIKGADGTIVKKVAPNILEVENLGKIFLAELIIQYHSFRLTMMRFELGCPTQGDASIAVADANGNPAGGTG